MSLIQVDHEEYSEITHHGTGPYDGDCTDTMHEINGLKLVGERDFRDLITTFDVQQDVEYLLVYATYSTGDSFSHHRNACIEFVDLFTYEQIIIVRDNVERIKTHYKNARPGDGPDYHSINLIHHSEIEYKTNAPWMGFFEDLIEVDFKGVKVTDIFPEI